MTAAGGGQAAAAGGGGGLTVRYFAAAREAAGVGEETVPAATDLAALLTAVVAAHGTRLAGVLARCSFLVDGLHADRATPLPPGATIDVLPPFSGG